MAEPARMNACRADAGAGRGWRRPVAVLQQRDQLGLFVTWLEPMGLAITDQARFDRYIAALDQPREEPLMIDITPENVG